MMAGIVDRGTCQQSWQQTPFEPQIQDVGSVLGLDCAGNGKVLIESVIVIRNYDSNAWECW